MISQSGLYPVLRLAALPMPPGKMMLWLPESFGNFAKYIGDEYMLAPSPSNNKDVGYSVFAPDFISPATSVLEWPMDTMTADVVRSSLNMMSHMYPEHNAVTPEEFSALRVWLGDSGLWVNHLKIQK